MVPMTCIPCRVRFNGQQYEISRDGSVRPVVSSVIQTDGTVSREYGLALSCDEAATVRQEAQRLRRNRNARDRADALRSLGMKRTRNGQWE